MFEPIVGLALALVGFYGVIVGIGNNEKFFFALVSFSLGITYTAISIYNIRRYMISIKNESPERKPFSDWKVAKWFSFIEDISRSEFKKECKVCLT